MTLLATMTGARPNAEASWRWPDAASLRIYLSYALLVGLLFVIGYGGANWLAAQRDTHFRLYWDAELAIPLIPAAIWVYLSINLLFALPVFRLDPSELRLLGRRMIAATVIATVFFIAMPTVPGFERLNLASEGPPAFHWLYALDYPFNCVPSLHVSYSTLIVLALARRAGTMLRVGLGSWLALIMASTLLTHQHHLIDIAAALLLVGAIHFASEARS
jgi:hypothetical protein